MQRGYSVYGANQVPDSGTFYFRESGPPGTSPIDWSEYNTFISHKSTDLGPAQAAAMLLANAGLVAYLDRWDRNVNGDDPDLEDYLRTVIRRTPSILTIVSEETITSWWVPFEVGVARETESEIATFLQINPEGPRLDLPSYLKKWPILASPAELQTWAVHFAHSLAPGGRRSLLMEGGMARMAMQDYRDTGIFQLEQSGRIRFVG